VKTIGQNLKNLRKKRGLTQTELAGIVKVTQTCISEIESDKYIPDIAITIKLATALNVSVAVIDQRLLIPTEETNKRIVAEDGSRYESENPKKMMEGFELVSALICNKTIKKCEVEFVSTNKFIPFFNPEYDDFAVLINFKDHSAHFHYGEFLLISNIHPQNGDEVLVKMQNSNQIFASFSIKNNKQWIIPLLGYDQEAIEVENVKSIQVITQKIVKTRMKSNHKNQSHKNEE